MDLIEYFLKRYKIIQKTYHNDPNNEKFINRYVKQIYVINLASNPIKRNYIKFIMKKLNINYTIIVVQKIHINVYRHLSTGKSITHGEVGTLLSHMWCLRDAIKNNYDKFIIFEDDVIFHKDFHKMFQEIVTQKDYDFLLLGASHFSRQLYYFEIKDSVYKPIKRHGNLLGSFGNLYTNKFAKKLYELRKKNIVYFDYNLYEIFNMTETSGICHPNLVLTDVSQSNINHNFNIFEDGYYDKCYDNLNFNDYHFIYLDLFYKWCLCDYKDFETPKKALIYLLANYLNNNSEFIKIHIKRLDWDLFTLQEINELIGYSKKKRAMQILYKNNKRLCKTIKVTPGYLLNNRLSQFRYLCLDYLPLIRKIAIPDFSPQSKLETVLIEYRKLPHMEFLIRNTILKLDNNWSHTVVCGNTNYEFIKSMCASISPNINIVNTEHNAMNRQTYSDMLTSQKFWEGFHGEKLLIYQEDSCIFNNNYKDFLKYDYIGAPWKQKKIDYSNHSVGNGGFSLRTKKVMMSVCKNFPIKDHIISETNQNYMQEFKFKNPPEDRYFTEVIIKNNLGNIPDWHTAVEFSDESYKNKNSFGGHQFWFESPDWKERMFKLNYDYQIEINKQLTNNQKQIIKQTPHLFHKVILNLVDINKEISYTIIKSHLLDKKFISHLHCYDIDKFDFFFKEYIYKIYKLTDIIITFCQGDPGNIKLNVNILKIPNKGMDIGGKFCAMKYLNDLNYKFNFILFLHSKTHDIIRKNWFGNIEQNLELVEVNNDNVGGYFPETIFTGDNSCLLWFNKVLASEQKIQSSLKNLNHYNQLYLNEIQNYLNISKTTITCFPEGNCYVLKREIANKMFTDPILYNILNTKTSFDYNWFKINYNININNILTCYELKKEKSLCGNNLEFKTKNKTLPDCMIEHVFERMVFQIIKSMNLDIKLLTKEKRKKNVEILINKGFDE